MERGREGENKEALQAPNVLLINQIHYSIVGHWWLACTVPKVVMLYNKKLCLSVA